MLKKLREFVVCYEDDILKVVKVDFNKSEFEVKCVEVGFVLSEIDFVVENFVEWIVVKEVEILFIYVGVKSYIY